MGKLSRRKGSAFERKVARSIAKAVGATKKDIYRTPLSGGHPYADRGDLVIARKFRKRFPYCVECKHQRDWNAEWLFAPTAKLHSWFKQALTAAVACKRTAMLVICGNRTETYCAVPHSAASQLGFKLGSRLVPYASVKDAEGHRWLVLPLTAALAVVRRYARAVAKKSPKNR